MLKLKKASGMLIALTLLLAVTVVLPDCGHKTSKAGSVTLSGQLDNSSLIMASQGSLFERLYAALFPADKAFAGGQLINDVIAVNPYGDVIEATQSNGSFSLDLPTGNDYLVALLYNTTIVALYKADASTGMDAFPISSSTSNIDLGTVSLNVSEATGTISSTTLLQALGMSADTAKAFGVMGVAFKRLSNIDVDGNGIMDFKENKHFDLTLDYGFNTGQTFTAIQGNFSNKNLVTYQGYEYFLNATTPNDSAIDWTSATLNSPQNINNGNNASVCWNQMGPNNIRSVDFFCGESASLPVTPPEGTYVITAGTTTLTFRNMQSQSIDPNLYNIYMPVIMLTMANGQIAQISWQWWKNTPSGWVQPSETELSTVLSHADAVIGDANWASASNRVYVDLGLTVTGSVVPPAQNFTPGAIRVEYNDMAGFNYGFEWK